MSNITRIDDARAFKRAGLPLNMTVEHKTFSHEYSRRWFAMLNANVEWVASLMEYAKDNSRQKWRRTQRTFATFDRAAGRFADYHDVTTDDGERQIIAAVAQQTLFRISDHWDTLCEALNGGEAVTINARDLLIEGAP